MNYLTVILAVSALGLLITGALIIGMQIGKAKAQRASGKVKTFMRAEWWLAK